jgi:transcriptional regulator with XRE-family HTH domain/mannose-6-phosphate isomerase-like protein (cupin superfamily)
VVVTHLALVSGMRGLAVSADFDPGTGLGPRLRVAREGRQLSVRELARRIGCSASLISQIERGVSVPSVGVLYSLATELDSSLDYLLFGSDQAKRPDVRPPDSGSVSARADSAQAVSVEAASAQAVSGQAVSARPVSGRAVSDGGYAAPRGGMLNPVADPRGIVQRADCRKIIDLASGVRWERLTPGADAMTDFLKVIYSPGGHSTDERRPLRHDGREYGLVISGTLRANVGFESYELGPGDSIAFDSSTPHEYLNETADFVHAIWVVVHTEPGRA